MNQEQRGKFKNEAPKMRIKSRFNVNEEPQPE